MAEHEYATHQTVVLHARAHRNFRKHLTQHLKQYKLTVMEWALLGLVSQQQNEGVSVTDLANMLNVKTALASVMVSKQSKSGLLDKIASKKDSRLRHVCLTKEGKAQVDKIEQDLQASLDKWLKANGAKDIDKYMEIVTALAEAEDPEPASAD